jgi:hypothetical protein
MADALLKFWFLKPSFVQLLIWEHRSRVVFASVVCNGIFMLVPSDTCTSSAATDSLPRFDMAEEEENLPSITTIDREGLYMSTPGRGTLLGQGPGGRIFIGRRKGHFGLKPCVCNFYGRSMPNRDTPTQHNERPICSNGAMA